MKMLLAILFILFPLAASPAPVEPPNVTEARRLFLGFVTADGGDAKKCTVEYIGSDGTGHYVDIQCAHLATACVFQVHPTGVLQRPVECRPNPKYVKETTL